MNPQVLHDYIIFPTLKAMGSALNTPAARQLLLSTAGQESHCGEYFTQIKGPALGIFQMEPPTVNDLYQSYLIPTGRVDMVRQFSSIAAWEDPMLISLVGELFYATALARMNYYRRAEAHPAFNDFGGMWRYYKKYWNSELGAATEAEFKANWKRFVKPVDFSDPSDRLKSKDKVH